MEEKNTENQIELMAAQLASMQETIRALSHEFYKNNFSEHQDFNKSSSFTTRLKVPHYSSLPSTCAVGEIAEASGKLYICSAANTWTVSGTQS